MQEHSVQRLQKEDSGRGRQVLHRDYAAKFAGQCAFAWWNGQVVCVFKDGLRRRPAELVKAGCILRRGKWQTALRGFMVLIAILSVDYLHWSLQGASYQHAFCHHFPRAHYTAGQKYDQRHGRIHKLKGLSVVYWIFEREYTCCLCVALGWLILV